MARIDYKLPVKDLRGLSQKGLKFVQRKNPYSDYVSLYIQKPIVSNSPKQKAIRANFAQAAKLARAKMNNPAEVEKLRKIKAANPRYKTLKGVAIAQEMRQLVK